MIASQVAAATAAILCIGILYDTFDIIRQRHRICRLINARTMRVFPLHRYARRATRFVETPGALSVALIVRSLAAIASVYFFAYDMPLAIVSSAVVVALTYLSVFRLPLAFNGAHMMQRLVAIALLLFAIVEGSVAQDVVLGFIAFTGLSSYFIAGISKLRSKAWRDGTAVAKVIATDAYGLSSTKTLPHPWISSFLTYSTLVFEIVCPFMIFFGVEAALAFFAMAVFFHMGIAVVSGLASFLFSFPATFPAIYFVVIQLPLWL
jgi:hypothetical protein